MLVLSLSFLNAVTRLQTAKLKRVPKLVQMLHANRSAPSLHVERLRGSALYSARLDRDHRVIIGAHPLGHVLLHVDGHDDAYRWADRHGAAFAHANDCAYDSWAQAAPQETAVTSASSRNEGGLAPEASVDAPSEAPLVLGSIHSWADLEARFRWDTDAPGYYLRERGGRIVCACLRADMNPNAPWEILVGTKPENIRQARLLEATPGPIPVFVKEAVDQWEYWGEFVFDRFETEASEVLRRLPENRRDDTALIAFLREVADGPDAAGE